MPYLLTRPAVLLSCALAVHAAGRISSLGGPGEYDSFLYCVSAYEVWQPDATVDHLVSEKPAGQAVLTGWCYRLASGAPSRLVLVPIESAFLLAAYGVFWVLARRLFGRRVAAFLTLFFVIAYNTYNLNDGFNLNECYLAFPALLAVLAHLTISRPLRRGFVRGLGLGLSLTIKQTAVGLPLVCLLHGVVKVVRRKRPTEGLSAFGMTLVGILVAWSPVVLFLVARGWLRIHLHDLMTLSGRHGALMPLTVLRWRWDRVVPLLPLIWWVVLGVVTWIVGRWPGPVAARAEARGSEARGSAALFAVLWFAAEVTIIWAMVKPWAHYYQQIAAPAAMLAGFGITTLVERVRALGMTGRMMIWRWVGATTGVLTIMAAMPLLAATSVRAGHLDRQEEIAKFSQWREEWSRRSIGKYFREIVHGDRP